MSPRHLATTATTAPPSVAMLGTEKRGEGGSSELRRFEVQLQPRPGAVTEEELEEALEAAAEGVEDISEHWEDAMAAVRRTEALFPLYKHTEEDSLRIRATQASGEQRNILYLDLFLSAPGLAQYNRVQGHWTIANNGHTNVANIKMCFLCEPVMRRIINFLTSLHLTNVLNSY